MIAIYFASSEDLHFIKGKSPLTDSLLNYKLNNNEIIIASQNDQKVGFLILDYLWEHIPFISFIKVLKAEQRKGIGKEILNFLESYLKNQGQLILFSSSMESAKEAQKWHRKMGFADSGLIHNINGNSIGEIFFRKELK